MKNKQTGVAIIIVIVIVSWSLSPNKKDVILSYLTLNNIEALANNESSESPCEALAGSGCFHHVWYSNYRERR